MAEPAGEAVIRATGLTKRYPRAAVAAVDGIDLAVGRGELFGLLGPNGAGKTTTVGMLTTRVVPTAGQAVVAGIDVVARPTLVKQLIAVVTQQNTLDRSLTVRENLYFHGLLFGMPSRRARAEADAMLERFRLASHADDPVQILSGGTAQRLMVARAILHRPAVLFLDEPTAGLDPQSRLALWEVLGELVAERQTILLTTHNMEEADRLCDRVAIIDHGRILALDTPAELKRGIRADTQVTVQLAPPERALEPTAAAAAPDGDGRGAALAEVLTERVPGVVRTRVVDGRRVELQLRGRDRVLPRVLEAAESSGFHVADLSVTQTSLETVFIRLTGKELRE
ncbi:ABC transporter ATP-binding protein [Streptacidiphilus jiangxiensis]|uniref:ABC-2 type transport system ATP-binding protein n=1 Tax=Streptacidiphilus jiangxiensis TaxID=235985 RepID=A0A1H7QN94_STRJI|nr:ATP-binding cassette domain-containing protein [Streptacidiphilus jiangxiensis]SEL49500.1 ABC-2 type transport system ATP-binding protein [Streptacidiphilus jiangxiensis]